MSKFLKLEGAPYKDFFEALALYAQECIENRLYWRSQVNRELENVGSYIQLEGYRQINRMYAVSCSIEHIETVVDIFIKDMLNTIGSYKVSFRMPVRIESENFFPNRVNIYTRYTRLDHPEDCDKEEKK